MTPPAPPKKGGVRGANILFLNSLWYIIGQEIELKLITETSHIPHWILNDSQYPIQIRILTHDQIHSQDHLHKTMHEYFYILEGELTISLNGNTIELKKDDLLVVDPGERHFVKEKSEDIRLFLIMPAPVPNDKVEF